MTSSENVKNNFKMSPVHRCSKCDRVLFVECRRGDGCPCRGTKEKVILMHAAREKTKNMTTYERIQRHIKWISYSSVYSQTKTSRRTRIKRLLSRSGFGCSILKEYEDNQKDKTNKGRKPTIELIYLRIKQKYEEEGNLDKFIEGLNNL